MMRVDEGIAFSTQRYWRRQMLASHEKQYILLAAGMFDPEVEAEVMTGDYFLHFDR